MKVRELIEKLKTVDPEMLVVVGGFDEEGYADISRFELIEVAARKSGAEVFGEYKRPKESEKTISAVLVDH